MKKRLRMQGKRAYSSCGCQKDCEQITTLLLDKREMNMMKSCAQSLRDSVAAFLPLQISTPQDTNRNS